MVLTNTRTPHLFVYHQLFMDAMQNGSLVKLDMELHEVDQKWNTVMPYQAVAVELDPVAGEET